MPALSEYRNVRIPVDSNSGEMRSGRGQKEYRCKVMTQIALEFEFEFECPEGELGS